MTLPALHLVQDELRCVPLEAVREIADLLDLSPAEVHDTMSFYGFFREREGPARHGRGCGSAAAWRACCAAARNCWRTCVRSWASSRAGRRRDGKITAGVRRVPRGLRGGAGVLVNDEHRMNVSGQQADRLIGELSPVARVSVVDGRI